MPTTDWERVIAQGAQVPQDVPLSDLTAELTRMLGDPDPHIRDAVAFPTMATWISAGVYDDLLMALGDGMCAGLTVGLGESGTDSVFRRSFSALVLAVVRGQAFEVLVRVLDHHDRRIDHRADGDRDAAEA
ncbi:MAG TPA: hypothetical protein PLC19_09420, partial [Marmoricola sp.]|nr:hypothetical protein [Marmoricola sp.]